MPRVVWTDISCRFVANRYGPWVLHESREVSEEAADALRQTPGFIVLTNPPASEPFEDSDPPISINPFAV